MLHEHLFFSCVKVGLGFPILKLQQQICVCSVVFVSTSMMSDVVLKNVESSCSFILLAYDVLFVCRRIAKQ